MAKAKATKSSNPPQTLHPPYFEMITEAITTLKDKTGSTQKSITKFIQDKYDKLLPPNFKTILSLQLKELVRSEKITKVKNSYKISETNQKSKNMSVKVTEKKDAKKESLSAEVKEKKCVKKTKRLSQVKTPEALKNAKKSVGGKGKNKVKRLSQVQTPEGFKTVNLSRKDKKVRK